MLVIRSMFFNVVAMLWLSVHGDTGIKLIVDTDMGFDVDDVGAVCLANALQKDNKTSILVSAADATPTPTRGVSLI